MTTVLTGEQIPVARLIILRGMLRLEIIGMRRGGGPSAYSILKKEFGFTGTKEQVLVALVAKIQELTK